jgi:hypothetical protein
MGATPSCARLKGNGVGGGRRQVERIRLRKPATMKLSAPVPSILTVPPLALVRIMIRVQMNQTTSMQLDTKRAGCLPRLR